MFLDKGLEIKLNEIMWVTALVKNLKLHYYSDIKYEDMRKLIILTIFISVLISYSITGTAQQNNNDILILSILIQDHLRKTKGRDINLVELLKEDTLNRISNRFEKVELKSKGGHISVYFKLSKSRDSKGIELSYKEKERTDYFRWKKKELKNQYDGEIQYDYGERFYRLIKIIILQLPNYP